MIPSFEFVRNDEDYFGLKLKYSKLSVPRMLKIYVFLKNFLIFNLLVKHNQNKNLDRDSFDVIGTCIF